MNLNRLTFEKINRRKCVARFSATFIWPVCWTISVCLFDCLFDSVFFFAMLCANLKVVQRVFLVSNPFDSFTFCSNDRLSSKGLCERMGDELKNLTKYRINQPISRSSIHVILFIVRCAVAALSWARRKSKSAAVPTPTNTGMKFIAKLAVPFVVADLLFFFVGVANG